MTKARFPTLLSPGRIGQLELKNRILMSPMGSNLARADGHMGERILRYYEERAKGGVALITVGVGAITFPDGACNPNQVAISDDVFLPGLRELTRRVSRHGCRSAIQLQHAGKVAVRDMVAGREMWVPSVPRFKAGDLTHDLTPDEMDSFTRDLRQPGAGMKYREMTAEDVATLVGRFAEAAVRARDAGFDGVELHAGHGYILSSFLSPASNRREDLYGGPLENRARFLVETIRAVKAAAGSDFPVWCRLDAREFRVKGGISQQDGLQASALAVAAGADAIHVSAYADPTIGAAFTEAPLVHEPSGYVPFARAIRERVDVPVIAVGRIEPEAAEALLAEGGADFVAMARKLLADPALARKLVEGRADEIRPCIYCYTCVGRIFLNKQSACAVNPLSGREFESENRSDSSASGATGDSNVRQRVLVVGGGPAGLEAARLAAERGHPVTLFERGAALGGALRLSTVVNPANTRLLEWLTRAVERLGVDVRLGVAADAERIAGFGADIVLIATGARRGLPEFPGVHESHVWRVDDAVGGGDAPDESGLVLRDPGRHVVVIGGRGVGLSFAAHYRARLAGPGCGVTVLEPGDHLGSDFAPPRRWRTLAELRDGGVPLITGAQVESVADGAVRYVSAGEAHDVEADTVLIAGEWSPDESLANAVRERGCEAIALGDCHEVGLIEGAMAAAGRVVRAL